MRGRTQWNNTCWCPLPNEAGMQEEQRKMHRKPGGAWLCFPIVHSMEFKTGCSLGSAEAWLLLLISPWGDLSVRRWLALRRWHNPIPWKLLFGMTIGLAKVVVIIIQPLSCVQFFETPWTAACQAPLLFAISWHLLKFVVHWASDAI